MLSNLKTLSNLEAAILAQAVACAMDMHISAPLSLTPVIDARLAPNWQICGYLVARDHVFTQGLPVYYGFLARSVADPTRYLAAVRGTLGILEWIKDAEFVAVRHPVAGTVEEGFYSIYASMELHDLAGVASPAAAGIAAIVGAGTVTVLGHSLGSAIATYLAFDLAAADKLGDRTSAAFFASPRPGNAEFGRAFDARVRSYRVYNYELDIVPRVPRGPDYTDLPVITWIGIEAAAARIRFDFGCHHHALCYAAMLDFDASDWAKEPPVDAENTACILGPHHGG